MLTNGYTELDSNPHHHRILETYERCHPEKRKYPTKMIPTKDHRLNYKFLALFGGIFCFYFYVLSVVSQHCFKFLLTTFLRKDFMFAECSQVHHFLHFLLAHCLTIASGVIYRRISSLADRLLTKVCDVFAKNTSMRLPLFTQPRCASIRHYIRKLKNIKGLLLFWKVDNAGDKIALISKSSDADFQEVDCKVTSYFQNRFRKVAQDCDTKIKRQECYEFNKKTDSIWTARNIQILLITNVYFIQVIKAQNDDTRRLITSGTSETPNSAHNNARDKRTNKLRRMKNIKNKIRKYKDKGRRFFLKIKLPPNRIAWQKYWAEFIQNIKISKIPTEEKRKYKWKKRHKGSILFSIMRDRHTNIQTEEVDDDDSFRQQYERLIGLILDPGPPEDCNVNELKWQATTTLENAQKVRREDCPMCNLCACVASKSKLFDTAALKVLAIKYLEGSKQWLQPTSPLRCNHEPKLAIESEFGETGNLLLDDIDRDIIALQKESVVKDIYGNPLQILYYEYEPSTALSAHEMVTETSKLTSKTKKQDDETDEEKLIKTEIRIVSEELPGTDGLPMQSDALNRKSNQSISDWFRTLIPTVDSLITGISTLPDVIAGTLNDACDPKCNSYSKKSLRSSSKAEADKAESPDSPDTISMKSVENFKSVASIKSSVKETDTMQRSIETTAKASNHIIENNIDGIAKTTSDYDDFTQSITNAISDALAGTMLKDICHPDCYSNKSANTTNAEPNAIETTSNIADSTKAALDTAVGTSKVTIENATSASEISKTTHIAAVTAKTTSNTSKSANNTQDIATSTSNHAIDTETNTVENLNIAPIATGTAKPTSYPKNITKLIYDAIAGIKKISCHTDCNTMTIAFKTSDVAVNTRSNTTIINDAKVQSNRKSTSNINANTEETTNNNGNNINENIKTVPFVEKDTRKTNGHEVRNTKNTLNEMASITKIAKNTNNSTVENSKTTQDTVKVTAKTKSNTANNSTENVKTVPIAETDTLQHSTTNCMTQNIAKMIKDAIATIAKTIFNRDINTIIAKKTYCHNNCNTVTSYYTTSDAEVNTRESTENDRNVHNKANIIKSDTTIHTLQYILHKTNLTVSNVDAFAAENTCKTDDIIIINSKNNFKILSDLKTNCHLDCDISNNVRTASAVKADTGKTIAVNCGCKGNIQYNAQITHAEDCAKTTNHNKIKKNVQSTPVGEANTKETSSTAPGTDIDTSKCAKSKDDARVYYHFRLKTCAGVDSATTTDNIFIKHN